MKALARSALSTLARLAITGFAFWWVLRLVDLAALRRLLTSANPTWLGMTVAVFGVAQLGCITRWWVLVPRHPALTWPFLANSFFVSQLFSFILPTTVGGDVVRGYDLIKATGEWKAPLASILGDRLVGFLGFMVSALIAWLCSPAARQDPLVRTGFLAYCALVIVTFVVLGSRRVLHSLLSAFSKVGLGQLESHAKQFQEALRAYLREPRKLAAAFGVTVVIQLLAILMFATAAHALNIPVSFLYLALVVPMILTVAQVPVSLNGWGVREAAAVTLLGRVGVAREGALSMSLICAAMPLLTGTLGGILFLLRRRRRKPAP